MEWTPKKLKAFKQIYDAAVKNDDDVFIFEDNEFLTTYAKYLIEHLNDLF